MPLNRTLAAQGHPAPRRAGLDGVWELRFDVYALPVTLFAVIETSTWTTDEVRSWADAVIQAAAVPASWALDLSLVEARRDASAVAMRAVEDAGLLLPDDFAELLVGLLYLRLQRGDLSRERFVAEVGDVVDAYQASAFDLESWTRNAANFDSGESPKAELGTLGARASDALGVLKDIAQAAGDPSIARGATGKLC